MTPLRCGILSLTALLGGCFGNVPPPDHGDFEFSIQFHPAFVADPANESLLGANMYPVASDYLNERIRLPQPIPVLYITCRSGNALWNATSKSVEVCHQLGAFLLPHVTSHLAAARLGEYSSSEELDELALNTTLDALRFIFFHEIGHALIDLYGLPITGREEDVADQFATWILLGDQRPSDQIRRNTTVGQEAAFGGAVGFAAFAHSEALTGTSGVDWASTHSFDLERNYNIICWVYGSDPRRLAWVADEADHPEQIVLPARREPSCAYEWQRIHYAFSVLLRDYLK